MRVVENGRLGAPFDSSMPPCDFGRDYGVPMVFVIHPGSWELEPSRMIMESLWSGSWGGTYE